MKKQSISRSDNIYFIVVLLLFVLLSFLSDRAVVTDAWWSVLAPLGGFYLSWLCGLIVGFTGHEKYGWLTGAFIPIIGFPTLMFLKKVLGLFSDSLPFDTIIFCIIVFHGIPALILSSIGWYLRKKVSCRSSLFIWRQ